MLFCASDVQPWFRNVLGTDWAPSWTIIVLRHLKAGIRIVVLWWPIFPAQMGLASPGWENYSRQHTGCLTTVIHSSNLTLVRSSPRSEEDVQTLTESTNVIGQWLWGLRTYWVPMSKEINEGKGMDVLPGSLKVEQSFCIAGLGNPWSAHKILDGERQIWIMMYLFF